jgi:hypothetical protein
LHNGELAVAVQQASFTLAALANLDVSPFYFPAF